MTEPGAGEVQEKEKALLAEIIQRVNDLFEGDLTDHDKLVHVNNRFREHTTMARLRRDRGTTGARSFQFGSSIACGAWRWR